MWDFGDYATYVIGILASADMIRNSVIAIEPPCYAKYIEDCISSVKSTKITVINDVYLHVQCKKRNTIA